LCVRAGAWNHGSARPTRGACRRPGTARTIGPQLSQGALPHEQAADAYVGRAKLSLSEIFFPLRFPFRCRKAPSWFTSGSLLPPRPRCLFFFPVGPFPAKRPWNEPQNRNPDGLGRKTPASLKRPVVRVWIPTAPAPLLEVRYPHFSKSLVRHGISKAPQDLLGFVFFCFPDGGTKPHPKTALGAVAQKQALATGNPIRPPPGPSRNSEPRRICTGRELFC